MRWFKWLLIAAAVVFFTLVGVSWLALEQSDVITIQTQRYDESGTRTTRAWFVIDNQRLLLEAGNPNNPWVLDIANNPKITLDGTASAGSYCTRKDDSESAHQQIRRHMRKKYGWRDQWVEALFDVSKSALVVATPCT